MNPNQETLDRWAKQSAQLQAAAPRCASCSHFQITPDPEHQRHGFCSLHGADIDRAELQTCDGWQNVVAKLKRKMIEVVKADALREQERDQVGEDRDAERERWKRRGKRRRR